METKKQITNFDVVMNFTKEMLDHIDEIRHLEHDVRVQKTEEFLSTFKLTDRVEIVATLKMLLQAVQSSIMEDISKRPEGVLEEVLGFLKNGQEEKVQ